MGRWLAGSPSLLPHCKQRTPTVFQLIEARRASAAGTSGEVGLWGHLCAFKMGRGALQKCKQKSPAGRLLSPAYPCTSPSTVPPAKKPRCCPSISSDSRRAPQLLPYLLTLAHAAG